MFGVEDLEDKGMGFGVKTFGFREPFIVPPLSR